MALLNISSTADGGRKRGREGEREREREKTEKKDIVHKCIHFKVKALGVPALDSCAYFNQVTFVSN